MKLIYSMAARVAVRFPAEEVMPAQGLLQRSLISFVQDRYAFSVSPPVGPGVAPSQVLDWQSGEFISENGDIPVGQLLAFPDGYMVACQTTELCDIVMTDLLQNLEEQFLFRFSESNYNRIYLSNLVVKFDQDFVDRIVYCLKTLEIINNSLPQIAGAYSLQRLVFGNGALPEQTSSVRQMMPKEFTIERRFGEPPEKNRFFCVSPQQTTAHAETLQALETAFMKPVSDRKPVERIIDVG